MAHFAIAIHGGCGVMAKLNLTEAEWSAARADLAQALRMGWAKLVAGAGALDAVAAAVVVMEDSPHFNAGHGAALNTNGEHELDAAVMDGATLGAGAVCAARRIRNPVKAARALMERGESVLLTGSAADSFAQDQGLDIVDPHYFTTERRREALASMKAHEQAGTSLSASEAEKHGTVGAVALDAAGHLAAATSTGGFTNKPVGRVGDSPIIGAGTYARDGACAVSGTGKGEYFIRHVVGHEIASRMRYLGETLKKAADKVVMEDLAPYKIGAGLVAIDAAGNIAAPYNTDGMFRGWVTVEGDLYVATHDEVFFVERLAGGTTRGGE
ncbi:isoaspartyl peptidase/L-asparaginase family protein [Microvirga sp. TS319]|uniref:isoaspartyl peptidase/L-asparaginase family protein n=1 Tax=Microvirga sp. TS319 TaxID=3241165 RepID=UPI003519E8B2